MNFARFCGAVSTRDSMKIEVNIQGGEKRRAYVCVSPLGDKNHPARQARTTTTRPIMMLQLE
jgi:hypothetical protein